MLWQEPVHLAVKRHYTSNKQTYSIISRNLVGPSVDLKRSGARETWLTHDMNTNKRASFAVSAAMRLTGTRDIKIAFSCTCLEYHKVWATGGGGKGVYGGRGGHVCHCRVSAPVDGRR